MKIRQKCKFHSYCQGLSTVIFSGAEPGWYAEFGCSSLWLEPFPERCSGQWNGAGPCRAPGHKSLSVSFPSTISWLWVIAFSLPAWPSLSSSRNRFKQLPVREGRGYRGGTVKKQQCSLGVKLRFLLKGRVCVCVCVCVCVWVLSCVWLFATPGTVAQQAPTSIGFSRQEYWNGLPFPPPGDLPDPEISCFLWLLHLQAFFFPGGTSVYVVMYSPSSRTVSLSCFADTETVLGGRS